MTTASGSASSTSSKPWFEVENARAIASPALIIYPERVDENLRRMLVIAGSADRLRPHIKTHKMPHMIARQLALGITKYKCATVAEAEMAAGANAPDVLLACQPVGPNAERLIELCARFPNTKFSTIVDDATAIDFLAGRAADRGFKIEVMLDLDVGQHRTGVEPGPRAVELYSQIAAKPPLIPGGLHVYDGHIDTRDRVEREALCAKAFAPVISLRRTLAKSGLAVPRIVAGGSPTFPIHARQEDVECSPGTSVFWDAGYAFKLPDCDFLPAALLLTRVLSKPGTNRLCLDLGHKAVGSEMPHPRVRLLNIPEATFVAHSEEHLVLETSVASKFAVGDILYAMPWHICPTVALHAEAWVIENGRAVERWPITARARRITI